jgi:Skp family chaperone for outer membrane proteins
MTSTRRTGLPAILAAGIVLILTYRAVGTNFSAAPPPVTAATVDLEKVFENLAELSEEQIHLTDLGNTMHTEDQARQAELTRMDDELKTLQPGTDTYNQLESEFIQKSIEYQAWTEFTLRQLDREKALVLEKVYNSVKQAVRDMAVQQGYDIIYLNDSLKPLQRGTEASIQQQISARRMLYTNPALDITDDLIQRMNNAFNAGG